MDWTDNRSRKLNAFQNRVVSRKRDGRFDSFPSPPTKQINYSERRVIGVARTAIRPREVIRVSAPWSKPTF